MASSARTAQREEPAPGSQRAVGIRGHRVRNPALAEARRRSILLAAASVFGRKGYEAATMDDIAREGGITKGCLYYYFTSKEDIFVEIRTTALEDALARLEGLLARGEPPALTLRRALRDQVWHMLNSPLERYANVLATPSTLSEESRRRIRQLQKRYRALIASLLAAGMQEGAFVAGDPKLVTFTLMDAALGVGWWFQEGGAWSREAVVEHTVDFLMRAVQGPARR
jgi:AcrR family transcriptional regulator